MYLTIKMLLTGADGTSKYSSELSNVQRIKNKFFAFYSMTVTLVCCSMLICIALYCMSVMQWFWRG